MFKSLRKNKSLLVFLVIYSVFMFLNLRPVYLDSDEAGNAMTSVFYYKLINDLVKNPNINPLSIYDYARTYSIQYPQLSIYSPVYTLIGGLVFLITSPSIIVLRALTLIMSLASLIIFYSGLRNWFNKPVSTITVLLTATAPLFFYNALKVTLDLPAFLFLSASFYFFTKSFNKPKAKSFFLCGFFSAISILTNELAVVYSAGLFLVYLFSIKRLGAKKFGAALAGLFITLTPYLLLAYFSGIPFSPSWYGAQGVDYQWYKPIAWFYFFNSMASGFSLLFTILFIIGLFSLFFTKDNKARLMLALVLISYLFVSISPYKNAWSLSLGIGYCAFIVSKNLNDLFTFRRRSLKTVSVLLITAALLIQVPLNFIVINTPLPQVADELIQLCPSGCSVLVASEMESVYSGYIMYESMLKDEYVNLRFIRPAAFSIKSAPELINEEKINYVVVIGSSEFIEQDPGMIDYFKNVQYITSRYELVSSYDSDLVGKVSIYRTGITELNQAPYCSFDLGVCTDFSSPIEALA